MKNYTIKQNTHGFTDVIFNLESFKGLSAVPFSHLSLHLEEILEIFFNEILKDKSAKYLLISKVELHNAKIRALHKGILISVTDKNTLFEYIKDALATRSDDYTNFEINKVILSYFKIEAERVGHMTTTWPSLKPKDKLRLLKFNDNTILPDNMNYETWGRIIMRTKDQLSIVTDKLNYFVTLNPAGNKIEVIKSFDTLYTFVDRYVDKDTFARTLNTMTYYIKDGIKALTLMDVKTSFLKPLKIKNRSKNKIITFDIETILKDNVHVPYLFSMYNGKKAKSWFTSEPDSLFKELLRSKYRGYHVYAHNLAMFDVVFIFKYLSTLVGKYEINIIKKENKIISINIYNKAKDINLTIRDSYLLLPSSLEKLTTQFDTEIRKGLEPVFVGNSKSKYYMSDLSHYTKGIEKIFKINLWKKRVKVYCETDCISLYQVLIKFKELIYDNFEVNIDKTPTLPSLAYAIFRTKYLNANEIPLTGGALTDFLRESYTGGSTEMYKPYGENVYVYDVNSLYPAQMVKNNFPVGKIQQFEGDITILDKDKYYWMADAFVQTKVDLDNPYLQVRVKTDDGMRTIAPNGRFNMKINSPEYYNALKDYDITIYNGYVFESKPIFKEIITDLYEIKAKHTKSDPMYLISKLLMNSLYGRFAMQPVLTQSMFIKNEELADFIVNHTMVDIVHLDENTSFIRYEDKTIEERTRNNSVMISSAVTAYARVFMSQFKNNPEFDLLYTDTDSIFVSKPINGDLINNALGNFKLEYVFLEFISLGPKIYAGIDIDGKYICKVKGYKNSDSISFDEMKSLLNRNSTLELNHDKWIRNLYNSNITIVNTANTLQKSVNKRQLIYKDDILVDTKAFEYKSAHLISNEMTKSNIN